MTDRAAFPSRTPYLIAEIGVNHDGDADRAADMVRRAVAAGFDAVKFQYWLIDELLAPEAPAADYQQASSQQELLDDLSLSLSEFRSLRQRTAELNADFVITPDGLRAFHDVITLDPDVVKIGSGDADNPHLIKSVVESGKPVVVSTGMMTDDELSQLLARVAPIQRLAILHCVSAYPTPVADAALTRLVALRDRVAGPIGFSDHTLGVAAPSAAIALGASVIEKHVTWDTAAPGPDHAASLHLDDAADWTAQLRDVAIAVSERRSSDDEAGNRAVVRKALYARRHLRAGDVLTVDDVALLRPLADGIPAGALDDVVGSRLSVDVAPGERLTWASVRT